MGVNKHTQNQLLYTHIHAARDSNHGRLRRHGRISYENDNDNEKTSTPDYICALQILRLKACQDHRRGCNPRLRMSEEKSAEGTTDIQGWTSVFQINDMNVVTIDINEA